MTTGTAAAIGSSSGPSENYSMHSEKTGHMPHSLPGLNLDRPGGPSALAQGGGAAERLLSWSPAEAQQWASVRAQPAAAMAQWWTLPPGRLYICCGGCQRHLGPEPLDRTEWLLALFAFHHPPPAPPFPPLPLGLCRLWKGLLSLAATPPCLRPRVMLTAVGLPILCSVERHPILVLLTQRIRAQVAK